MKRVYNINVALFKSILEQTVNRKLQVTVRRASS